MHLVGGWRGGKAITESRSRRLGLVARPARAHRADTRRAHSTTSSVERRRAGSSLVSAAEAQQPTANNASYAAAKAAAEAWTLARRRLVPRRTRRRHDRGGQGVVTPQMRAAKPDATFAGVHLCRATWPTRSRPAGATPASRSERAAHMADDRNGQHHDPAAAGSPATTTPACTPEILSALARPTAATRMSYGGDQYTDRLRSRNCSAAHFGDGPPRRSRLQRHRRQRRGAAGDDTPLGGGDLRRDRAHQRGRVRRPRADRRAQAPDGRHSGRQAHPRAHRRRDWCASATSTRRSRGSSRSRRRPNSARSTRRPRSPRWPSTRTRAGCCCTSTARGSRTPPRRSACRCGRSPPTWASTSCRSAARRTG